MHLAAADGAAWEIGSVEAPAGTLHVACPTLSASSPRGAAAPEITAVVYKDGQPWREGCGDFPVEEAGAYRVRFDITPWHLADFLGADPSPWLKPWPLIYTNPIAVSP